MARTILDTSALWDRNAILELVDLRHPILPAVAFTERARQIRQAGRSVDELNHLIRTTGLEVEPFMPEHGLRYAAELDDSTWRRHARDSLIAGHVEPDDVLWTKKPRDFKAIGLGERQIRGL